jgi:hypothetical protein
MNYACAQHIIDGLSKCLVNLYCGRLINTQELMTFWLNQVVLQVQ